MAYKLFVYGTLMPGFGNNVLLSDAKYIGEGFIEGTLLALGGIPGYIEEGMIACAGHVYEVNDKTLARTDRLEGFNIDNPDSSMYVRKMVHCAYMDGEDQKWEYVYVYVWNGETSYPVIESGDYDQHRKQALRSYGG